MTWPSGVKGLSTFRARIFWSLIPIILSLFVFLGVIDLRQQRRLAEEEFMKRGRAMAANLAYSSELGVFGEDRKLLESSIRGVAADTDFAYVFIYGEDWRILANDGRQPANMKARRMTDRSSGSTTPCSSIPPSTVCRQRVVRSTDRARPSRAACCS